MADLFEREVLNKVDEVHVFSGGKASGTSLFARFLDALFQVFYQYYEDASLESKYEEAHSKQIPTYLGRMVMVIQLVALLTTVVSDTADWDQYTWFLTIFLSFRFDYLAVRWSMSAEYFWTCFVLVLLPFVSLCIMLTLAYCEYPDPGRYMLRVIFDKLLSLLRTVLLLPTMSILIAVLKYTGENQ